MAAALHSTTTGHGSLADSGDQSLDDLHELLTVDDVAALLKVSRKWVYEHTRSRKMPRSERLPHIKLGKYVRFGPCAVRAFLAKRRQKA